MAARLVGAVLALLAISAVGVYGVFGADIWRWGCPSQAEMAEPWSRDEVQSVFARSGLDLVRVEWPPGPRNAASYRGVAVFRHERPGAVLHVLVCTADCSISRFQIPPGRFRFGFDFGTNVVGWMSGRDRSTAARLQHALSEPLAQLNRNPDPGSRCYIG